MQILTTDPVKEPSRILYSRCVLDLQSGEQTFNDVPCSNLEDVLGGFGRSFQQLAKRPLGEAYCDENPLIINTGLLTGSTAMTGMRTYFSAYSPLKQSLKGLPAAIWSAGSGKFGAKFKWTGLDELILENRSDKPVYLVIRPTERGPQIDVKPAEHLCGLTTHEKIMELQQHYENAHFAAIGPAGENWHQVLMGSIALSTENQLRSGEDKQRFAGRGGMGSMMGYKNVLALVAQAPDQKKPLSEAVKKVNTNVVKGGGAARLQPIKRGGGGGTWAAYDVLQPFHAVPVNNFRPQGNDLPERMLRENVDKDYDLESSACWRCGITCHNYVYEKKPDGSRGEFLSKFDYEPLNLLSTNIGIHDPGQGARLIQACDLMGMDAISLGVTLSYLLAWNERHPDKPLFDGVGFGDYEKIRELILATGKGSCPDIGSGSMRLSQKTGETDYAYHVKGLEIAAYQPETNPGYIWAIAGGHMTMGTYGMLIREGKTDFDSWVDAITRDKLQIVGFDMIGLCKFFDITKGIGTQMVVDCLKSDFNLEVTEEDLRAAVHRAFILGLIMEKRQGYTEAEYALPAEVAKIPNPHIKIPDISNLAYIEQLSQRVWAEFKPDMETVAKELGLK
ncbi:MAG TPA: aldehyde ferredoxin oxidoreductase C-terminal domain-containing protein [Pelovirga sp.]|nr:aldehyde ferredoxin oxidoreductase C-terminal domain-containing protein [Pelovirga sp.]